MKKQPGISHKYFPFTWCNVKKQMGSIRYSEFSQVEYPASVQRRTVDAGRAEQASNSRT